MLNATPVAKKRVEEGNFFESCHDIQSRTKTKKALINAHSSKTGDGGSAIPDLSQSDEKISEIIGDTAIRGLGVVESQVQEIEVDDENPTNSADFPKSRKKQTTWNDATQHLDEVVDQSNKTIALLHEEVQLKKDYLRRKLELMERNEHIASELKDFKDILLAKFHNI
ncbi:hypothetical protein JTB14_011160 [Gonioctena quinquepunctata]|nr:hypothetical protein JTB14_011160 [Gonioctena quinquepunctata]